MLKFRPYFLQPGRGWVRPRITQLGLEVEIGAVCGIFGVRPGMAKPSPPHPMPMPRFSLYTRVILEGENAAHVSFSLLCRSKGEKT